MLPRLSVWDRVAIIVSLAAIVIASYITNNILEGLPHLEDEYAYVWQAETIAEGQYILPSPPCPKCFLVPFVVDYNGSRFGKYPLAWPVVLSFGIRLGARNLVNPILSGFSVWLIYLLGKKILDEKVGLLAAFLTISSPFFLMNSSTLLSHPWSLFLSLAFVLAWFDSTSNQTNLPPWLPVATAGLALGILILTRPLTAVGVSLPFLFHGLFILLKGSRKIRINILIIGVSSFFFVLVYLLWQFSLTGNPFLNPYTLWWPYDTIGFGPGIGRQTGGYNLHHAWINTKFSLIAGSADLFGWYRYSWLFLPFGLIAIRKNARALLAALPAISLVLIYTLYWIGSWLFGPRYYYEGLFSLILLSAAGIAWLAGQPTRLQRSGLLKFLPSLRFSLVYALLLVLIAGNTTFYLPPRLDGLKGLYQTSFERLKPFYSPQALAQTPALVIIHVKGSWTEYAAYLNLSNPFLNSPFIFTISKGTEQDNRLKSSFPDRAIWHYYPDNPFELLSTPR